MSLRAFFKLGQVISSSGVGEDHIFTAKTTFLVLGKGENFPVADCEQAITKKIPDIRANFIYYNLFMNTFIPNKKIIIIVKSV